MRNYNYQLVLLAFFALLAVAGADQPAHWPPSSYVVYYGGLNEETLSKLQQFELAIIHPGREFDNFDDEQLRRLKAGRDGTPGTADDVVVIGYVSVGESEDNPGGPPPPGAPAPGPSYFQQGQWKLSQGDYPTRFLDQRRLLFDDNGFLKFGEDGKPQTEEGQDGIPDENGVWGSYYVRAGDPEWRNLVTEKFDRLKEMGVDGFFLDTVDTASPWGAYGATQQGMLDLIHYLNERYADRLLIANRGLFFLEGKHPGFVSDIEGVMFESYLCHYDFVADRGELSPWLRWHVAALDDSVAAAAQKGFHLFFLEYVNPEQRDLPLILHTQQSLLDEVSPTLSFAHPNLQTIYPSVDELFPASGGASVPEISTMTFEPQPRGDYRLTLEFQGAPLKPEHVVDVRIDTRKVPKKRAFELQRAEFEEMDRNDKKVVFQGRGLNKDTTYQLYARVVGQTRDQVSETSYQEVTTPGGDYSGQVQEVAVQGLHGYLKVTWKADILTAARYRVYLKRPQQNWEVAAEVKGDTARVQGLEIGTPYHVKVVAVRADGQEGCPSVTVEATPQDCRPPSPPSAPQVSVNQDGSLDIAWQPGSEDSAQYRVYCVPSGHKFRLPLRSKETRVTSAPVRAGDYRVFVTAIDDQGNQSQPGPAVEVTVP